jgi:hypothetical protein
MYINRTVIRWRIDQVFHGGRRGAFAPNWQHPPVVSLFFLILAILWFGFFRYFRHVELKTDRGT